MVKIQQATHDEGAADEKASIVSKNTYGVNSRPLEARGHIHRNICHALEQCQLRSREVPCGLIGTGGLPGQSLGGRIGRLGG